MENREWIENEFGEKYQIIQKNGTWKVIRFYGDGALYSFCDKCGFIHPCYKDEIKRNENDNIIDFKIVYDKENEYIYCPKCGRKKIYKRHLIKNN